MAIVTFDVPDDDPLVVVTIGAFVARYNGRIVEWVRHGPAGTPAARAEFSTDAEACTFAAALALHAPLCPMCHGSSPVKHRHR